MLLNRKQIEEALPPITREVPVPEFGEGATVLIGTVGPLEYGRLQDLFGKLAKPQQRHEPEDDDGKLYTCDTPPDERPDGEDEADDAEDVTLSPGASLKLLVEWAAASIVDPTTFKPMFTPAQIDETFRGPQGRTVLVRIVDAAQELNLQTKESREELEKNSDTTASDVSGGE